MVGSLLNVKRWRALNLHVYVSSSYIVSNFIYARKAISFYVRAQVKFTRQWKSTLKQWKELQGNTPCERKQKKHKKVTQKTDSNCGNEKEY